MDIVERITSPSEFKDLCDRLLRQEFGSRFQSFAGLGPDGGIDGLWTGLVDGVEGDWVFQYKFAYPPVKGVGERESVERQLTLGTKSRTAEFDKPGVAASAGYFLLTNVPATVPWVLALRDEWKQRYANRPFTVWDVGGINGRIERHAHLGHTRSAALHAIAMTEIVPVIWMWTSALYRMLGQQHLPLWPVVLRTWQHAEYLKSVTEPWGPLTFGFVLVTDRSLDGVGEIDLVSAAEHRIAPYIASTVFKQAFAGWPQVLACVERLAVAVQETVENHAETLRDPEGTLRDLSDDERVRVATAVAFFALKSVALDQPVFSAAGAKLEAGNTLIFEGPEAVAAAAEITSLMRHLSGMDALAGVNAARAAVLEAAESALDGLWHPARTGLDAPGRE